MSRDETHDSIDPTTGALTGEALARRQTIMDRLREAGHEIVTWADALFHLSAASDGESPPDPETVAAETAPAANEPAAGADPLARYNEEADGQAINEFNPGAVAEHAAEDAIEHPPIEGGAL